MINSVELNKYIDIYVKKKHVSIQRTRTLNRNNDNKTKKKKRIFMLAKTCVRQEQYT